MEVKPLELRRLEADLIYVYKLLHGQIDTDYHKFFELKTSITRGHNYTLKKNNFHKDVYRHFFANRTTNIWNKLPNSVVNSPNVTLFKNSLNKPNVKGLLCTDLKGRSLRRQDI